MKDNSLQIAGSMLVFVFIHERFYHLTQNVSFSISQIPDRYKY